MEACDKSAVMTEVQIPGGATIRRALAAGRLIVACALLGAAGAFALWTNGHPFLAVWAALASIGVLFVHGAGKASEPETDEAFRAGEEAPAPTSAEQGKQS